MSDSQGLRPDTAAPSDQPDMAAQRAFWNEWNIHYREDQPPDGPSLRRSEEVLQLLASLGLTNPRVLEVGCANGWLAQRLSGQTARLVGTDLADECVRIASAKYPHIQFVAGNFLDLKFHGFDVVVCVDSMASIADHATFVKGLADALEPGGHLILTTQNPFVMRRRSTLAPVAAGQVRNWTTPGALRALLSPYFEVKRLYTVLPAGDRGVLRLTNSRLFAGIIGRIFGESAATSMRESLGLGQTIVVFARKKVHRSQ